jgi:hypothetical protein
MTTKVFAIRVNEDTNSWVFGEEAHDTISLDFLQSFVGGWVQVVPLAGSLAGLSMWLNEEGKFSDLGLNELATAIWEDSYGATDFIVGNVLITGGEDYDGEITSLTSEETDKIMNVILHAMETVN